MPAGGAAGGRSARIAMGIAMVQSGERTRAALKVGLREMQSRMNKLDREISNARYAASQTGSAFDKSRLATLQKERKRQQVEFDTQAQVVARTGRRQR